MKLLIVEDEQMLADDMAEYLRGGGYQCEVSYTLADASYRIGLYDYETVIVDLNLPDGNGLKLIEQLKSSQPDTGIIIVSARDSVDDKIRGLKLGSDDYLTKPFHLSELNARVDALMRRRRFEGNELLRVGELTVHSREREIWLGEHVLDLTPKEYDLLLYFITNRNRVLTKTALAEYLWGDQVDDRDTLDFIYVHIKNIRHKITAAGGRDYIRTIYGVGYQFSAS